MIQHITAMNVLASSAGTEAPALDYRTLHRCSLCLAVPVWLFS